MMKYLITQRIDLNGNPRGSEIAHIFSTQIEHKKYSELLLAPLGQQAIRGGFMTAYGIVEEEGCMIPGARLVGATLKVKCSGESFSLGLNSDPEKDSAIIAEQLEP